MSERLRESESLVENLPGQVKGDVGVDETRVGDCEHPFSAELPESTVRARPAIRPAELDGPSVQADDTRLEIRRGDSELERERKKNNLQRQRGQKATRYDVFLSYRVNADVELVESFYDKLSKAEVTVGNTKRMLRVFWDKKCLVPGEDWDTGFVRALCNSRVVVIVMSRSAYEDIGSLTESSPCDNFILEHILTMELVDRERLNSVMPVFVGDLKMPFKDGEKIYTDFFTSGCLPEDVPDVVVRSINEKVKKYLSKLGVECSAPRTVRQVHRDICQKQGVKLEGARVLAVENAVKVVHECAAQQILVEREHDQLKHFQQTTPLGQEVYDWLCSYMLSAFAPTFSRHNIDSLYKASLMTPEQVDRLNRDYYKTSGTALQANQVGSHVMLSTAIIGLKGDERAFSCSERLKRFKDESVSWRIAIGLNNQLEIFLSKPFWRTIFWFLVLGFLVGWMLIICAGRSVGAVAELFSGRPPIRLTSFRIFLAVNGSDWRPADCGQGLGIQCALEHRNEDPGQIVSTRLSRPEYARFVRIVPSEWEPDMLNENAEARIGIVGAPDLSSRHGRGDRLDYLVIGSRSLGGARLMPCSMDEHCSFPGCYGSCVDGACFKGTRDSKCVKTPNLAFENGDRCLKGISGRHCPTKVGSLDGTAPLVFDDEFLTLDVHAPQTITGILIQGSPEHRPLAFSPYNSFLGLWIPVCVGSMFLPMLLLSRMSPYKGVLWGFFPGFIFFSFYNGLGLLLSLLECSKAIVPSISSAPALNCDESKCRSSGTMSNYFNGTNTGYDCWGNEYGPLPPYERSYEPYSCADGYTGKFVYNGMGKYAGLQYYTCCKNGVTPSSADIVQDCDGSTTGYPGSCTSIADDCLTIDDEKKTCKAGFPNPRVVNNVTFNYGKDGVEKSVKIYYYTCCKTRLPDDLPQTSYVIDDRGDLVPSLDCRVDWAIRFELLIFSYFCLFSLVLVATQLFCPQYFMSIFFGGLGIFGVLAAAVLGDWTFWSPIIGFYGGWIFWSPIFGFYVGFLIFAFLLRIAALRKARQMTELQIEAYEFDWARERERTLEGRDSEYILNEGGENGGWDKGVSSAVKGRTSKLLRRIRSKKAVDMRSDKTCEQALEQIGDLCGKTKARLSLARKQQMFGETFPWYRRLLHRLGVGGLGLYSRHGKRRQRSKNIDIIFAEATTVNDPFFELVRDALFVTPGGGVALNGRLSKGPTKLAVRALQKTVRKYFRDPRCLTDLVRCCVILDSIQDVCKCLEGIISLAEIETECASNDMHADEINHAKIFRLTKVKDRFSSNARIGYRDICLNLEVAWKIESERNEEELEFVPVDLRHCSHVRTHICEVQLMLNSTYQLKEAGGHETFVQIRNLVSG